MFASKRWSGCVTSACSTQLTTQTVVRTSAPMLAAQKLSASFGLIKRAPSTTWSRQWSATGHVLAIAAAAATNGTTK